MVVTRVSRREVLVFTPKKEEVGNAKNTVFGWPFSRDLPSAEAALEAAGEQGPPARVADVLLGRSEAPGGARRRRCEGGASPDVVGSPPRGRRDVPVDVVWWGPDSDTVVSDLDRATALEGT